MQKNVKRFIKCKKIYQIDITKITKKDYKKSLLKKVKIFLKKKKKKSGNMGVNNIKLSLNMKTKTS